MSFNPTNAFSEDQYGNVHVTQPDGRMWVMEKQLGGYRVVSSTPGNHFSMNCDTAADAAQLIHTNIKHRAKLYGWGDMSEYDEWLEEVKRGY